jgi:hypothetical protein
MPALQTLVLTDRKATPVNHTFTPTSGASGVAQLAEATGVPIGDNRVTISSSRTSGGRYKSTLKFSFPVVQTQTVNGVSSPVVVRTGYAELTFNFADTSTEAERNDIVGMVASALATTKTIVNDTVVKTEGIW